MANYKGLRFAGSLLVILAWIALFSALTVALLALAGTVASSLLPLRMGIGGAILVVVAGIGFFLLLYAAAMLIRLVLAVDENIQRLRNGMEASDDSVETDP